MLLRGSFMKDLLSFKRVAGASPELLLAAMCLLHPAASHAQNRAVKLSQRAGSYILQNAYVTAEVDRTTGDLKSLKYGDEETMGFTSGHHAGYWEQNPSAAAERTDGISIDPAANAGERAEVYIRGKADGRSLLHGPGEGMVVDMEIRYSLGKADHGIYTYAIFTHPASYPATGIGESRFGAKLNGNLFDWLSTDARHNLLMPSGYDWDHGSPLNMKEARRLTTGKFVGKAEHKYDYSVDLFDSPAIGWSSTTKHIGLYLINPSQEYLSSGPTKYELTAHIDDGAGGDPTILDYWRSSHYGGSTLSIDAGEAWSKVVGPILIYVNHADTPQAMFQDANAEAARQHAQWPFAWVQSAEYALAAERGSVSGRLTVRDGDPAAKPSGRMWVGLVPQGDEAGRWQQDAKHYQFWVNAAADGSFSIPQVRAGVYTLAALADGVFGEYDGPSVTVAAGKPIALGSLDWKPMRYGRQLWDIGYPNRNGSEFFMGDQYDHWGMYLLYAKLFPNDVHYTLGKSDYRKDWYFEQVPNVSHGDPAAMTGPDTTWTISFQAPTSSKGTVVLRAGICGVAARHVFVSVNGSDVGDFAPLVYNATINRDGIQGSWSEHDVSFPAGLLRPGENQIALRIPGGNAMSGIIYDYLRLELDETGANAAWKPSIRPLPVLFPIAKPNTQIIFLLTFTGRIAYRFAAPFFAVWK
jgi:rhamnogalacturonan endolyase